MVGDAEVKALYDGVWEKSHDPAFFSNATVRETKRAPADAGSDTDFVTIPISTFVVRLNGKTVFCDAGGGRCRLTIPRRFFFRAECSPT